MIINRALLLPLYVISVDVGAGGSVSPGATVTAEQGGDVTLTFTPPEGGEVTSLIVDGEAVTPTTTYSFTNINSDHSVVVGFTQVYIWSVWNATSTTTIKYELELDRAWDTGAYYLPADIQNYTGCTGYWFDDIHGIIGVTGSGNLWDNGVVYSQSTDTELQITTYATLSYDHTHYYMHIELHKAIRYDTVTWAQGIYQYADVVSVDGSSYPVNGQKNGKWYVRQ